MTVRDRPSHGHGARPVITPGEDGGLRLMADAYSLAFDAAAPYLELRDRSGRVWADLATLGDLHTTSGLDSTHRIDGPLLQTEAAVGPPQPQDQTVRLVLELGSPRWASKRLSLECGPAGFDAWFEVDGAGQLTECRLFGGFHAGQPSRGTGLVRSAALFSSVFAPEPGPPDRFVVPATQPVALDVLGGSGPGRGHWFFAPPPLCFGFSHGPASRGTIPDGPWMTVGLVAPPGTATFSAFHYEVGDESFAFRLDHEGYTSVAGTHRTPALRFRFDAPDPYRAVAAYRETLETDGLLPSVDEGTRPAWWRRPIFCGWGAQAADAMVASSDDTPLTPTWPPQVPVSSFSTQARYDHYLETLESHGLRPGTVVIDDKWQRSYGASEVDESRWPDLGGWIAERHARGQRVLLWWKAWDPEGLDTSCCVRRADGTPVAADPTNEAYIKVLRESMRRMLSPDGYGADGLKLDFTAQTPSGPGMTRAGEAWGMELLRLLLTHLRHAAKAVRPDALLINHAVEPTFAPLADMVRLNDTLRLADPRPWPPVVPQMLHRARIVRAACPDALIDTDDWAMPDRATFREYLERQPELGVPALYYVDRIDLSGEPLLEEDFEAIRRAWRRAEPPSDGSQRS
jgi:hypothetical protein